MTRLGRFFQASPYIVLIFLISSCSSLPRMVMVNDPLSAAEHADLAAIYEARGDLDLAITEGKEALRRDPGNFKAAVALGNSYFRKGDYKEAEAYYLKGLETSPDNGDLLNNMAHLYLNTGRIREAEKMITRALSSPSPNRGYYYDTLGSIYEKMGKNKEAREAFRKAQDIMPRN